MFNNYTIDSKHVYVYVLDKYGTKHEIEKSNGKFYIKHTNNEDLYDFVQYKYGKYFIDFFLSYDWEIKGIVQYAYDAMFSIHATIEVTKCDVRTKVTTINKELITPKVLGENSSIFIGDINGDSEQDIGFSGGFLENVDNNDRTFVKYRFSYLYDSNDDDIFNATTDSRVYFAEHISDTRLTSTDLEGFLYYDEYNLNKAIILGEDTILGLTTSSNVDGASLYASFESEGGEGGGGGVVSNWHSESDTEQTITSSSYVEKHTLDFTAPAQGDYLIIVSCEASSDSSSNFVGVRAQLDDTTTFMEMYAESPTNGRSNDYRSQSSMYVAENLASGSHNIDIDAMRSGGTGYIRYARIVVLRLDDWLDTAGMYEYGANEGVLDLTAGQNTYSDAVSITFTPDEEGDYLVLASMEMYSGSNKDSIAARIDYDSASEYLPVVNGEEPGTHQNYITYESENSADWHAFTWGGIVNIPASSKTIKVEACRTAGTTSSADVRRRRIIAIRLDAMSANTESTEDAPNSSTTSQWTDKSTLIFTPSSQQDYFIIGGMVIKPDSSAPGHAELTHTAGTNTGTISLANVRPQDSTDPADCIPMMGIAVKELNEISQTFKTRYGYAVAAATTRGKGSFIIAIPLGGGGGSPSPTTNVTKIGDFTAVENAKNKFYYNWTDIQSFFSGYLDTGDNFTLIVELNDVDFGSKKNITYNCVLDFEAPTSTITIGDGQTDYSLSNFAAPWTLIDVSSNDNLESLINHNDYYYSEPVSEEFQVKVFDHSNNLAYQSGFSALSGDFNELFDLDIPVVGYEDHSLYYYMVEIRLTDAAGNSITNSSYLGDSYTYDGGIAKILVSNEVTIQFEDNLIDINRLYSRLGDIINFTLLGPDNSELKNKEIQLKSDNYFIKTTLWNDTTQSYQIVFDNLHDLVLRSDNLFKNQLYSNYEIDHKLNWDSVGDDYYAFAKHASQEEPLGLRFNLQELRTAILCIPEKEGFIMNDFLSVQEVYCYKWDAQLESFNDRYVFNSSEYSIAANGTISWTIDLDQLNAKNSEINVVYYGSDYADILKNPKSNGMFFELLIPNIYSTHGTIETLDIEFRDFDNNVFYYRLDALDLDKYYQNASLYRRVIPGLSEMLEIPIYIDFVKLAASNIQAPFDISSLMAITFIVIDAPVWPGSLLIHDPDLEFTVINYPYQIFGVSEISLYDLLPNNTQLTAFFSEFGYDSKGE